MCKQMLIYSVLDSPGTKPGFRSSSSSFLHLGYERHGHFSHSELGFCSSTCGQVYVLACNNGDQSFFSETRFAAQLWNGHCHTYMSSHSFPDNYCVRIDKKSKKGKNDLTKTRGEAKGLFSHAPCF